MLFGAQASVNTEKRKLHHQPKVTLLSDSRAGLTWILIRLRMRGILEESPQILGDILTALLSQSLCLLAKSRSKAGKVPSVLPDSAFHRGGQPQPRSPSRI